MFHKHWVLLSNRGSDTPLTQHASTTVVMRAHRQASGFFLTSPRYDLNDTGSRTTVHLSFFSFYVFIYSLQEKRNDYFIMDQLHVPDSKTMSVLGDKDVLYSIVL